MAEWHLKRKVDKRSHRRTKKVKGSLPGKLLNVATQCYFRGNTVDVSASGFAIVTSAPSLNVGDSDWLVLESNYIKLRVIYKMAEAGQAGQFRCGFQRLESSVDLLKVFESHGCVQTIVDR